MALFVSAAWRANGGIEGRANLVVLIVSASYSFFFLPLPFNWDSSFPFVERIALGSLACGVAFATTVYILIDRNETTSLTVTRESIGRTAASLIQTPLGGYGIGMLMRLLADVFRDLPP